MDLIKCRLCMVNADDYIDILSDVGYEKNVLKILKLHFSVIFNEVI